jgi:biopolymer transport protein ExbD
MTGMRKRVKIGRGRHVDEPEIVVIPMIDVMMFLLFFFMVSSLAMAVQAGLPVNLPKASTASNHPAQNITVTLTAAGEVYVETTKTILAQVGAELKKAGAKPENLIIINADKSSNYGDVVTVIDESGKVGLTRFTFATVN